MNFLSTALHGSTTMVSILIGQILVVASLAMMTIWLLVKRARFGPPQEAALAGAHFMGFAPASSSGTPAPISADQNALITELEQKCANLTIENKNLAGMKNEYTSLQEKIKFLESKLLEYEILQEEIGTLSMLKLENEKLKKEITKLQAEVDNRVKRRDPTPAEPATGLSAPLPKIEEENIEPISAPAAPVKASEKIKDPTPPAPAPVATAPAVAPTAAEAGGLDGLLSEIEALTADVGKE